MHNPEPVYPFDTIMTENWWVALNQMSRPASGVIPPALGIDHRIVNGYLYISPNVVTDPDLIAKRAEHFTPRAGHYYENWDEIYAQWIDEGRGLHRAAQGHRVRAAARRRAASGRARRTAGLTPTYDLLATYNRLHREHARDGVLPLRDARTSGTAPT